MADISDDQSEGRDEAAVAAKRIVEILQEKGYVAYFAGGCVRDRLMGLTPADYDIATNAEPEEVRRIFKRTIPVGEHFGVILVQMTGCRIEVATFRREGVYSDSRRPDSVEFTNAREDASRRDFTINGLFYDPTVDQIIDYVGGESDIHQEIIRAIGNADDRLAEDHLRALRAVRFAARFGFTIEDDTKAAVGRNALELAGVSRERIGQELRLMLGHMSAYRAALLLHELGLDGVVLNEQAQPENPLPMLEALNAGEDEPAPFTTAMSAWAVDRGVSRDPGFIRRWRKALLLTNYERDAVRRIIKGITALQHPDYFARDKAHRKRLCASPLFHQSLRLLGVIDKELADKVRNDVSLLRGTASGISPEAYISGDDLIEMGLSPGPAFRKILDRVYDAQLEEEVATREEALQLVRQLGDEV